ncbi:hypothetical protein cypCar_00009997 [Cyprinus carpio]|nr:hypothetical protein cypCar_00009997 [Cyprinus carpio]
MPCPVLLGTVKGGGLSALLHRYTIEKKVAKVEKVLKKGVEVDSMNHLGQTPLFCASLLGFASVAEKLLQYGANPNHRCNDGSTPVHAAVFSCNPWLLSSLLDAGGDLRLHDDQGRVPKDWAEAGAQENSPKMLAFLKRCESQMQRLLQTHLSRDERTTPTSSKTLLSSPSLLKLLRPRSSGLIHENNTRYKMSACDMMMHCFGYGKLCFEKPGLSLGLAASVLLISDCDLVQANDEPLNSFMCGSFIRMTNYSWKGYRVTVKELHDVILQKCEEHDGLLDLLISEQEYCCQLSHPHLLLLMAVSISADLDSTKLVYERVNLGSLYNVLHQRRDEFPLLPLVDLLSVVLQFATCKAVILLCADAVPWGSTDPRWIKRLYAQLGLSKAQKDSTGRSCLEEHFQTKPSWTSEVREMVALMTAYPVHQPITKNGWSQLKPRPSLSAEDIHPVTAPHAAQKTNASVSSVLQSPVLINISKDGREKIDSPSSGNAEFTTASCGARQTTETSQGASEEIEHPIKNNDVDEEGEEVGDGPSDSEHQCEQESSDKKVFDDEDIAERMEGCEGENPCQIHNQHPDVNPAAMDSNANLRSHNLEETEM